jgi:hypothetical protein
MNEAQIRERVAELRERYPELLAPLTWSGLRQLLAADDRLVIRKHRYGPKARIRAMGDVAVISFRIGLAASEWLFAGAHEWAHWLLHGSHDAPARGRGLRGQRESNPLEIEADFFARCLIAGVAVQVPWPASDRRASPIPRPRTVPRVTVFDPYADDVRVFIGRPLREPIYESSRRRLRPARRSLEPTGKILYQLEAVYYADTGGQRWELRDVRVTLVEGRVRQTEVALGSECARVRYFIRSDGERRVYYFTRWELRELALRHLERQIRESVPAPPKKAASEKMA